MDIKYMVGETSQLSCLVGAAVSALCGCEESMGDTKVQEFSKKVLK